jgi:polyvinyl alcohol dehydrogenase (cytochrome)
MQNANSRRLFATAIIGWLGLTLSALAQSPSPQTQPSHAEGGALFEQRCKSCHEPPIDRAPSRSAMSVRPTSEITEALSAGVMAPMATGLSASQIQSLVLFLTQPAQEPAKGVAGSSARPVVKTVDTMCAVNPPIQPTTTDWPMMGRDLANSRFQPEPGFKAADVARFKVKWAFSIANSRNAQPIVIGDWLWMLSGGRMYALDPKSGCVRFNVEGVSARNTPVVMQSSVSPSGWLLVVARNNKIMTAFDAQTGKEIWVSELLDDHPMSAITGSPIVSGDLAFVGITSREEPASQSPNYACCNFRGSLLAVDLATGKVRWKTYVLTEPTQLLGKNGGGLQMQGPAGAAIWSSPTVDAKRGLVYVATGDSYTEVPTKAADAIMAIEMKTGRIRWTSQVTESDNYVMGCTGESRGPNCPAELGPDYDFGASPILFDLPNGKQVVLSGQKSGITYGMDPETGKVLWQRKVGEGGLLGGIEWGIGADRQRLFAPNSDFTNLWFALANSRGEVIPDFVVEQRKAQPGKPGLTAIDPRTGKVAWHVPAPVAPCEFRGDRKLSDRMPGACFNAMSAAPAVMPGVVFQGAMDGWLRAYSADKGRLLWEDSTTSRTYATTNGVSEQPGGSIDGNGPTIAGGMVFVMSGYDGAAGTGGNGTNVLLAYSLDGK